MDSRVLKNLSWLVIANIFTKPLWFVFVIYSANILGVNDFGIYTFSVSFLFIFSMLLDMGLEQLLVRDVAKNKDSINIYFNNAITYKFLASILVFIIVLMIIYFSDYSEKIKISLLIIFFFVFSTSFITFLRAFFRAYEKIKYESYSILIEKLGIILLATIGLFTGLKLYGFLLGLAIGNFICLIVSGLLLFKKIDNLVFKPQLNKIKLLLKNALPFLIADIFIIIMYRFSSVLIMFITGNEEQVGLYNSSYRLIEMYLAFPMMMVTPVYPFISRSFHENKEHSIDVASKILKILLLVSFPITIVVFFDYIRVNQFLFTKQYIDAANGLKIIILTIIPLSINVLFGTILAAINRQKEAAFSVGICMGINIILNFILISIFQYIGAAITLVISESLITLMYYLFVKKYFGSFNMSMFLKKFILVVTLLIAITIFLISINLNLIISLTFIFLFYLFIIFLLKLVKKEQIKEYYKMLISK